MTKIAVFSSANEGYVPKALVGLLSFRRWHPEYGYYLLGSKTLMQPRTLELLKEQEIELIDVDESRRVARKEVPKGGFPIETFYLLKGPELLAERGFDRKYVTSVVAMLTGLLVIYAAGVTWLGLFTRGSEAAASGLSAAFFAGVYPFIIPDLIKLAIAAGFVPALWRLLGRSH